MSRTHCDVVDEVVIAAPPSAVWSALMSEHAGQTHWWAPYWEAHPRAPGPLRVGSEIDFFVHPSGKPTRLLDAHFAGRVTALVEERQASAEFFSGSTRGLGEWSLEPANGGTHLRMHFKARAHGARAWLLDAIFGLGSSHSRTVGKGFEGLQRYLAATSAAEPGRAPMNHPVTAPREMGRC
ncbi:MAG TPA: SRPBCC family protein [Methylomirabilota bacterium]|nr:SRPBCC family protein [Methylomirabilota bacterium]